MKFKFNPNLEYQKQAIDSILTIFEGQEICQTNFTMPSIDSSGQRKLFSAESDMGIGNRLELLDEELLENVQNIQLKKGLQQATTLESKDFTVEREKGT